jgi:opacity protein-like surface antigen
LKVIWDMSAKRRDSMIRRIRRSLPWFGAVAALLLLALPVRADDIEPEPYVEEDLEPEPEPEPEVEAEVEEEAETETAAAAEFDRNGPFLMAGGGYSFENFSGVGPLNVDDSPNLIFHAGWRVDPYAAAVIDFEWNSGFDTNFEGNGVELETYLTTIGMKIYALKGRFQPFLHPSMGIIVARFDAGGLGSDSKTAIALRGGGGFDYYVTENLFVSLSAYYVFPAHSEVKDFQYVPVSAAVGWRF